MKEYIGARRAENEFRWRALLAAALEQPQPTKELVAAIERLRVKPRGRPPEKRKSHGTPPI